jgi:hypothetical protein
MSKTPRFFVACALLVSHLFAPSVSLAWDGQVTGVPSQIDVTDGGNLGFRVYLQSAMCGTSYNWAYLNSTDSNYSTYVAALLMAKAQGGTVIIYSNKDSNGYCHIGYVMLT